MSERPSTLCRLKTGAPVAPQENFAATFNWVVSFCENLRGAEGVVVDMTVSDHPVVKAEKSDDADGGGAGGSGEALTVVTGLSFAFDDSGRLVATLSTKNVTLPAGASAEAGEDVAAELPLWRQTVVAGSAYDEGSHAFKNETVRSVRTEETSATADVVVFEAVQHDPEDA